MNEAHLRHGWRKWLALALLLIVVFAVSALGAAVTSPQISGWYAALNKPPFQPPSWVFGPVWTVLYIVMGVAAWRVWLAPASRTRRAALIWFALQLLLNAMWSPAFFGLQAPRLALAVIVLLLAALAITVMRFFAVDRVAGWMMLPYLAWVAFATLLNASIVWLN
jgi:tryptophan-rich sensory protein